jgi:O-antigen/teichoic acid export membrane protein
MLFLHLNTEGKRGINHLISLHAPFNTGYGFARMKNSRLALLASAITTLGSYGVMQLIRLASGIVIARLLTPDLLGIMVIVYVLRYGMELVSDIGIGQSIISNKDADKPEFYNTAWSIQIIRGFVLWAVFLAASIPVSHIYNAPILISVLPAISLYFILAGFTSMGVFLVVRRMQVTKLNTFDVFLETISAVSRIVFVYISPTIWALVFGSFVLPIARVIGSHFLVSSLRHKFFISKDYAWQIFAFGKWIFLSAVLFFLSSNFDRLYLGKVIPFALLGIFGIARTYSGIIGDGVGRLCNLVVFPLIVSVAENPREEVRQRLAPVRLTFLLLSALGISVFVAVSDFLIAALYDQRYQAAGWMLPVLAIGLWFTTLSTINEWTLIGIGRPKYSTFCNALKFAWILVALPLATIHYGMLGAVIVIAVSDLVRYFPVLAGQIRHRLSFGVQDTLSTLFFYALVIFWEWARFALGLGTSFDQVPI